MKDAFVELADFIQLQLRGQEAFLANYSGEDSEFVRFNRSAVRQPGSVLQRSVSLTLIDGQRQANGQVTLTGRFEDDRPRVQALVTRLRDQLPLLPEDPHLMFATEVQSSDRIDENRLPDPKDALDAVLGAGKGRDMVGILASGGIYRGFANSFGQRNWYEGYSFNLDWSFYHQADKAVKTDFAGFEWNEAEFDRKVSTAVQQLEALKQPARTVKPGHYRVYLSPTALGDVVGMLGWGGVGLKARKTRRTALLKLLEGEVQLADKVTLRENTADGVGPNFQSQGFIKPDAVTLIDHGRMGDPLVCPRSAKEYGVQTNGANGSEAPEAWDMDGGDLAVDDALTTLGDGVQVNNVWYLNFSDRTACRVTGMTRFATFLVENGEVVAPLNVMRWDETVYRVLGEQLESLTTEREMTLSSGTYGGRSTGSIRMPGALISDFEFTL